MIQNSPDAALVNNKQQATYISNKVVRQARARASLKTGKGKGPAKGGGVNK